MKLSEINNPIDRYKYEKELYINVKNGNKLETKKIMDDFIQYVKSNYKDDNKHVIKRLKYICITAISIYSRMSIEKGKSASESYQLADSLFQEIDDVRTLDEACDICVKATETFTNFNFERTDLYSLPIRKAIDYINNNIDKKITVSDINTVSKLSDDYLSTKFKEEVGINLKDYIINKKLDKAKNELMLGKYNKDIYLKYGFISQSYFIQCFKKRFKKTPKDYYINVIEKTMI